MTETKASAFLVLLAEDDLGDANLVKTALECGPYPCIIDHAWDGAEVMARLRQARQPGARIPDLLLLDINMPKLNGFEVLAQVRADPSLRAIPAVILSTSEAESDVTASYDAGASGYVSKPVDVDQLFDVVHAIETYWFGTMRRPR